MLVAQRPVVWDGSVCENLLRPLRFSKDVEQPTRSELVDMLKRLGMADKIDASAVTLSEGERQRVCLARALFADPNVLVLDEPTSALDHASVGQVESVLKDRSTWSFDTGVLLATHDRAFAERFCTRVIDLADYMPSGKAVSHA